MADWSFRLIEGEEHYPATEDLGRAPSRCFSDAEVWPCAAFERDKTRKAVG